MTPLSIDALTRDAFAPFGEVIDCSGIVPRPINDGTALRYDRLATVRTLADGQAVISVFRAQARVLPMTIARVERHPLGSQAFIPLHATPYLIVVAEDAGGVPGTPQAYYARGDQGVNYAAGVWHYPLIALAPGGDFLVVDRHGDESNCEEADLQRPYTLTYPLPGAIAGVKAGC